MRTIILVIRMSNNRCNSSRAPHYRRSERARLIFFNGKRKKTYNCNEKTPEVERLEKSINIKR